MNQPKIKPSVAKIMTTIISLLQKKVEEKIPPPQIPEPQISASGISKIDNNSGKGIVWMYREDA